MMNRIIIVLTFLAGILPVNASQNEANIWYFGVNAGLDFSSGTPLAITDGIMNTEEGCAVISDNSGKLLFYTDGVTIWNRNHTVMNNGTGLAGHSSSTQSGVIVPAPGNVNMFYVFSVSDRRDNNGFRYSVVDLSQDNGLGSVVEKNTLLFDNCLEKITAIRDKSCRGIWVIGHEWTNNVFRAYRISESGIDPQPVVSAVGSVYNVSGGDNTNKIGYMKASPDGKRIVSTIYENGTFEVFDFDNRTGVISNPVSLYKSGFKYSYGVEFSPDGAKLYGNTYTIETFLVFSTMTIKLYQFDLTSYIQQDIINSAVEIYKEEYNFIGTSTLANVLGAIQTGPDGKLYVARNGIAYLGVINNPNEQGAACNFIANGVDLGGRKSARGLPSFIQSFFYDMTVFRVPDTLGYAGDQGFQIPIHAELSCDAVGSLDISYRMDLRFDAALYYVDSVAHGSIIDSYIDDGDQVITIEDNDAQIGKDAGVLNYLSGRILLGDTNYTPIRLENIVVSNSSVDVDTVNGGLLVLGNCSLERRKMGVNNPVSMMILPNPAMGGNIKLKIMNIVPGDYKIELFNLQGQLISVIEQHERNMLPELLVPVSTAQLSPGLYTVRLTCPVGVVSKPLVVVE